MLNRKIVYLLSSVVFGMYLGFVVLYSTKGKEKIICETENSEINFNYNYIKVVYNKNIYDECIKNSKKYIWTYSATENKKIFIPLDNPRIESNKNLSTMYFSLPKEVWPTNWYLFSEAQNCFNLPEFLNTDIEQISIKPLQVLNYNSAYIGDLMNKLP